MRIPELQMCVYVGKYGYDVDFAGAGKFISAAHTPDKDAVSVGKFITRYLLDGYSNYNYESYDGSYAQKEVDCEESVFTAEMKKAVRRKKSRIKKLDAYHDDKKRIMLVSESLDDFVVEYDLNGNTEVAHFEISLGKEELSAFFQRIVESMA